jgi:hypothetical protein
MEHQIPWENRKIDLEAYLCDILEYHRLTTPYWQKRLTPKLIEETVTSNLEETLYNLSKLEVDQNLLRTDWLSFKPINLKNVKCSFSSGTTGPQKYCLWSEDYIRKQAEYDSYYLRDKGIKNAIIQGPTSVYKDINEGMINLLGGIPYFVGLRVEGIKPLMEKAAAKGPEEMIKVIKEYFAPEIEKTRRFLEHDEDINFMRSAWMMLAPFELFFGDKRNVDTVMVSGLGYNQKNHEMLKQKFKTVIPSYGYFAFGDALGKYENGNLSYYPAFPYTIFTVVKENGEIAKYGEEGNPLFVVARLDLLLVLKESNEFAGRAPPTEKFEWDGIRNPYRRIG